MDRLPEHEAVDAKAKSNVTPSLANLSILGVLVAVHPYGAIYLPRSSAMMNRMFFCWWVLIVYERLQQVPVPERQSGDDCLYAR